MCTRPPRLAIGILIATLAACRPAAPASDPEVPETPAPAADAAAGPIVILVSIDGARWDALDPEVTPALMGLADHGVRAEALVPVFPTQTFPNHYTLVTGLYPEHHGVVSNAMVDHETGAEFRVASAAVTESLWWGGEPIWVTAAHSGLRAATMFWAGSEAEIDGVRPDYSVPFDDEIPAEERVDQVLEWLALPAAERPSFVSLYFSAVDYAGHRFGPEALETREALQYIDEGIRALRTGIAELGLDAVTTLVVVSDHGMTAISPDRLIHVDDFVDLSQVDVLSWTPNFEVVPRPGFEKATYEAMLSGHPALRVFRREEMPEVLHYSDHPRIAPIIGMADEGWTVVTRDPMAAILAAGPLARGGHGYDPRLPSMHGIFVAAGPRLQQGMTVPAFENVHVYELLCRLLGISPAANDGDPAVTAPLLAPQAN